MALEALAVGAAGTVRVLIHEGGRPSFPRAAPPTTKYAAKSLNDENPGRRASPTAQRKYPFKVTFALEKGDDSSTNWRADHPAFIFLVVGQSRDDVLTVVQAGGHHPGSQRSP